ncbi:MAG: ATP synthase subunit I [Candidatus Korobacteraceae bacterium]
MMDTERPEDSPQGSHGAEADGARGDEPAELAPEDWAESPELGWAEASEQEMLVCRQTLRRIERMIAISGAVCSLAVIWPLGWAVAAGMLVGTALGWLNFRWLAASVNAIGDRIVKARSQESGATVVARGVGRIFLIALVACVIVAYSVRGLMGFLAGLAMPVIAMMCEAVYEFVASIRRPS